VPLASKKTITVSPSAYNRRMVGFKPTLMRALKGRMTCPMKASQLP